MLKMLNKGVVKMNNKLIELKYLKKNYETINEKIEVLKNINYVFEKGKLYAIKGHSGSGKTTLIKILGLMDNPSSGEYYLFDKSITNLKDKEASLYRMKHIGFIFQDYNLNPYLKATENIIVPMIINKEINKTDRNKIANKLLKEFGLEERANHFPKELSGGEQQRIAIARALANDPDIIIADEPTGNLDAENEKIIFKFLKNLAYKGKCVIVVSHSEEILEYADISLILENGILTEGQR